MASASQEINSSQKVSGVASLFFIQIFSTLAYAVLYSSLVLYSTKKLHFSEAEANEIMGVFAAFNYGLHLMGGCLGGRYLSNRNLLLIGMMLQSLGCLLIALAGINGLYWGLAMFLAGSGLNVTCINMMLTQRFTPEDHRRESAFLWNYAGMNIGFFVGFGVAGYFELLQNYSLLFLFAMLGNIMAIVLLFISWKHVKDLNTTLKSLARRHYYQQMGIGLTAIVLLVPLLRVLLGYPALSGYFVIVLGCIIFALLCVLTALHQSKIEQRKMLAYLILTLGSLVFWSLYQLAPMGLTLFTEFNLNRHLYGFVISPEWIQNINTIVIVIGGPVMAELFNRMRKKGVNITIPSQFAASLLCMGAGMLALVIGIDYAGGHLVAFKWIVISYVLQSFGELLISPIGYAMIGRLAPVRYQGFMMGNWMLVSGVAAVISSYLSQLMPQHTETMSLSYSNGIYHGIFNQLGWYSVAVGVVLILLIPFLTRLIEKSPEPKEASLASAE